jgi:hypothetical protein
MTQGPTPPCGYCGTYHQYVCPLVKAFEYHPDGKLKRVEFHSPITQQSVIQPDPITGWKVT